MTNPIPQVRDIRMRCPHCGGYLYLDEDKYEKYFTCMVCAREYDLDGKPRRRIPPDLNSE